MAFIRKIIPDQKENDEDKKDGGSSATGKGVREWVLFNDEKVVRALDVEEMKKFAYVYFFERDAGTA